MLSNRIGKSFAPGLEASGLSVAEWRVLLTLALVETASGQEITSRWALDKMAVNRAISALEKRHLVRKNTDTDDKRTRLLTLTAAGRRLYERQLPAANDRYRMLMAGLNRKEQTNLRDLLIKMIAHIDSVAN